MEGISLWTTLGIGFALGLKHALDVDHVVAVSTLVARERSFWRSSVVGVAWGLGHTLTLLVMGLLVIGLGWKISDAVTQWLEVGVALMLVVLGARALWEWRRGEAHLCVHSHHGHSHAHFHRHGEHECAEHECVEDEKNSNKSSTRHAAQGERLRHSGKLQSFFVGTVHGLSGSAALMLLVLSTIRHSSWGLTYIAVFGIGMMVSMFVMSALFSFALGLSSRWLQGGFSIIDRGLRGAAGMASLIFGLYLTYQIAVVDKLLVG